MVVVVVMIMIMIIITISGGCAGRPDLGRIMLGNEQCRVTADAALYASVTAVRVQRLDGRRRLISGYPVFSNA